MKSETFFFYYCLTRYFYYYFKTRLFNWHQGGSNHMFSMHTHNWPQIYYHHEWSEVALQLCSRYRRYYGLSESVGDKGTVCIDRKLSKINGWLFEKDTCSQRNMHQAIMAPQTWSEDRILKCHFLPEVTWQKVLGNKDGASTLCA